MIKRILICGDGSIGSRHLKIVKRLYPYVEILVMRRKDRQKPKIPGVQTTSCLSDILAFNPHLSIIANPSSKHVKYLLKLINNGSHILVEKPISNILLDKIQVLAAVETNKVYCHVGYNLRFLPSLVKFRQLIKKQIIGQVTSLRVNAGHSLQQWRDADYRKSVSALKSLGGGVMLELSHEIDYLQWIFGNCRWVRAWTGKTSNLDVNTEDTAIMQLGFEHKPHQKLVANVCLDFTRMDPTRECVAIGTNGTLHWDGIANLVKRFCPRGQYWSEYKCKENYEDLTYEAQLRQVFKDIAKGKKPMVSAEDGFRTVEIIEYARKSSKNRGIQQNLVT